VDRLLMDGLVELLELSCWLVQLVRGYTGNPGLEKLDHVD
jgi:hypothetical protein